MHFPYKVMLHIDEVPLMRPEPSPGPLKLNECQLTYDEMSAFPRSHDRGIIEAPRPLVPGYLRVETVYQGDQDGIKGSYHINQNVFLHRP